MPALQTGKRRTSATVAGPVTETARAVRAADVEHGQRRKIVAERLLADIFQGSLKAGTRLVIQDLAARFKMSPTPIREALVTLEGIGIVDIEPNRGAIVRKVTQTEVREVCQVRRALECSAVRSACGRIALADLLELATAFRDHAGVSHRPAVADEEVSEHTVEATIGKARALDSRLHDLIACSCGNRFLSKELGRMQLLFRAFRDVAWDRRATERDLLRVTEEAREHLAIVEALQAADPTAASRAMAQHIRSGLKYWSRGLPV